MAFDPLCHPTCARRAQIEQRAREMRVATLRGGLSRALLWFKRRVLFPNHG